MVQTRRGTKIEYTAPKPKRTKTEEPEVEAAEIAPVPVPVPAAVSEPEAVHEMKIEPEPVTAEEIAAAQAERAEAEKTAALQAAYEARAKKDAEIYEAEFKAKFGVSTAEIDLVDVSGDSDGESVVDLSEEEETANACGPDCKGCWKTEATCAGEDCPGCCLEYTEHPWPKDCSETHGEECCDTCMCGSCGSPKRVCNGCYDV